MKTSFFLLLGLLLFSTSMAWAQRPPPPRPLTPLTSDVLLNRIMLDPRLRAVGGGVSDAERSVLQNKNSLRYDSVRQTVLQRFIQTYDSDVKSASQNTPIRVEMINELKAQQYNIADINKIREEVRPRPSTSEVIRAQREQLKTQSTPVSRWSRFMNRFRRGGSRSLVVANVGLLGVHAWKDQRDLKIREQILNDAENKKCPEDFSKRHVELFVFEEEEVREAVLENCSDQDDFKKQLQQHRSEFQNQFARGQVKCQKEDGKFIIHTVSETGTKQTLIFNESGRFERLRVLPQPKSRERLSPFEGSYLEYSNFPKEASVRYYAVQRPNNTAQGPDLSKHHMQAEPLNSFSARVHCTVQPCAQDTPEYQAIVKDESLLTTPAQPFGQIHENKEFLIAAAKSLAQFRLGLEEATNGLSFQSTCKQLGGHYQGQENIEGLRGTLPANPQQNQTPAAR